MSETKRCPKCRAEIPAAAPEGLCPQCLLQVGLEPKTAEEPKTAAYSPSGSGFVPPTPQALQAAFPQLEILELLGKGGMGAVYKARQPGLDRLVAVKILPPEVSRDPAFAERFTREARALAMLNHPNIVGVYDSGRACPSPPTPLPEGEREGYYYFVMEYLDGVNLRQAMKAGELNSAEALKIVPQICDALQFAHDEGIVHRDIKPENILIDKKGRVKIADFGLAKLLGKTAPDVSLTGTQQVMGTMHYMAPEQLEGSRDVDHRADIYSLGVTFYEMLTGELPIGRFAAPSKKVQIDVRLDEVVLRSLEKEPEQRYQQASEIKTEVEAINLAPASSRPAVPSAGVERTNPAALNPVNLLEATSGRHWIPLVYVAAGVIGMFIVIALSDGRNVCLGSSIFFGFMLLTVLHSVLMTIRWTVEYRGHQIAVEFENATASRRLMIDGLTAASATGTASAAGGKTWDHELRATIQHGEGIGDEIVCSVRGMTRRCRIIALPKTPVALAIDPKSPEQRYQQPSETKTDLDAMKAEPPQETGSSRPTGWLRAAIVVVCLLIAAAGLVPIMHKNKPFWGLHGAFDGPGRYRVTAVENNSPAQKGGLKYQDTILAINRTIPQDFNEAKRFFDDLGPGDPAYLKVARPKDPPAPMIPGESPVEYLSRPEVAAQLDLTVYGEDPPIAMIYYYDYWHPIAGALAIALSLFVLTTPALSSRRRGLVVCIACFGLAIGFLISSMSADYPAVQIRRYHVLNWGEKLHFHQTWVGLAASLALAALGVLEMRRSPTKTPEPARPVTPTPGADAPLQQPPIAGVKRLLWYLRSMLFRLLAVCWTGLCLILFLFFWTPADGNWAPNPQVTIDDRIWPHHGTSESTVSLAPAAPTYRRLMIREDAEANLQGHWGGDFAAIGNRRAKLLKLTYTLELELRLNDRQSKNELTVDALQGMSWRITGNQVVVRRGLTLDAEVVADWLRESPAKVAEPADIDAQARAIVGIVRRAANNDILGMIRGGEGRKPVSRLDNAVLREMGAVPLDKPLPFRDWNAAENVKIEPLVPILYVGVPLMAAVWGIGLWLLLRRPRLKE